MHLNQVYQGIQPASHVDGSWQRTLSDRGTVEWNQDGVDVAHGILLRKLSDGGAGFEGGSRPVKEG